MTAVRWAAAAAAFSLSLAPKIALACACGCDVFDVGGPEMASMGKGGEVFVEYDNLDQSRNWSGDSSAPAADNEDKRVRTHMVNVGVSYSFSPEWSVVIEAPVWNREFHTENDAGGVDRFNHTAVGDVRLMGIYTGLSKSLSTGLIFGVKLPNGDWKYAHFDRDTQIGTGSTNLLLGAFHTGSLSRDEAWRYFVRALWDKPVASQGGYEPGQEFDAAAGISYDLPQFSNGLVKVVPVLQLLASARARDRGPNADPDSTGYDRLMLSPGVQFLAGRWALYGDVELPIYQHVNGDQLVAPALFKIRASRRF